MLDAYARRLIDPPLNRAGRALAQAGISANAITLSGTLIGLMTVPALWIEAYGLALALIAVNRLFDGLDGAVARHSRSSDLGGYLDIVGDFLFYSAVPFGFALADPGANALAAAFVIYSFIGTGASFLAYAILAAKRGRTTTRRGAKSFYYMGGLAEGTETIAFLVAACLFPSAFATLAILFGTLCWITTLGRILATARTFRD